MVDLEPLLIFFWSQFALAQQCNCARRRGQNAPQLAWDLIQHENYMDQSLINLYLYESWPRRKSKCSSIFVPIFIKWQVAVSQWSNVIQFLERSVDVSLVETEEFQGHELCFQTHRVSRPMGPEIFDCGVYFRVLLWWFCGFLWAINVWNTSTTICALQATIRPSWSLGTTMRRNGHFTFDDNLILGVSQFQFQFSHLECKSTSWIPGTLAFLASGIPPSVLKKIQGLLLAGDEGRICTDGHLPWRRSLCPRGGFVQVGMGAMGMNFEARRFDWPPYGWNLINYTEIILKLYYNISHFPFFLVPQSRWVSNLDQCLYLFSLPLGCFWFLSSLVPEQDDG